MDYAHIIGWFAVFFGVMVPLPQLYRMIKTGKSKDVSMLTYVFLCIAMTGYLILAISIGEWVFIVAQSLNLITNSVILSIKIRRKIRYG